MKRTLGSGAAEPGLADTTLHLTETRNALNQITRDLHAPIGATGMSAFRAIADLVRAKGLGLPPPSMSVAGTATWTKSDYETILEAAKAYAKVTQTSGPAQSHPWRGVCNEALEPTDLDRIAWAAPRAASKLRDLAKRADLAAPLLPSDGPTSLASIARLKRFAELLAWAPESCAEAVARLHPLSVSQLARAEEMIGEAAQLVTGIATETRAFRAAALQAETASVRARLAAGTSWFKRWKRTYRAASAELASWLTGPVPKSAAERVSLVDRLIDLKAKRTGFENLSSKAQTLFGPLWQGEATDLPSLRLVIAWLRRVREEGFGFDLTPALARLEKPVLQAYLTRLTDDEMTAGAALKSVISRLDLDSTAAFGPSSINDVGLTDIAVRLDGWASRVGRYSEWSKLAAADRTLRSYGLSVLADRIAAGALAPAGAVEEVRHARAEFLWKFARERNPMLSQLRDKDRTELVETFRQLETDRRQLAAGLIRARHWAQIPRGAVGDMGVIRGEIARKRGHMPIRKLMHRAGPTIQKIKPVFLMSPISIAQFIPPGAMKFDLLVIDEASQVRPEDALGVIARAKQIVVVGDAKQLPPTNFFNRLLSDDDVVEDGDGGDEGGEMDALAGAARAAQLESILTLCEARGVGTKMLRWHYRSKHPSLIEVSNDAFYDRRLFLPPSPVSGRDGEGFILKRVLGAYDRGGKRTNEIEAKAIVEALIDHADRNSDKSIGIVTFSTAQRDLILNLVDDARRREPALEGFLNDQVDETFVKNLENAQGDERDHILISVGYGPRAVGGRLDSMNFGPVSTDGGQRRLNVLFTRAGYCCEVFCSFDPADIDTARATSEGVKVLKRYLTFADTGRLDEPKATGEDYDSPFEEDVAREIKSFGFLADPQVGTAGFQIDLGVRDPEYAGRYILAVECDGAAYHGALWARERDRLRQEILEGQGWRFHRIWSTDWFYRRSEEINRLRTALEMARARAG
jgi:REase_MTES_1575/AAA domain